MYDKALIIQGFVVSGVLKNFCRANRFSALTSRKTAHRLCAASSYALKIFSAAPYHNSTARE
jgi:hypothetical protein